MFFLITPIIFLIDPGLDMQGLPPDALWGLVILTISALAVIAWALLKSILKRTETQDNAIWEKIDQIDDKIDIVEKDAAVGRAKIQEEFTKFQYDYLKKVGELERNLADKLYAMQTNIISEIHKLGNDSKDLYVTKTEMREKTDELRDLIERQNEG